MPQTDRQPTILGPDYFAKHDPMVTSMCMRVLAGESIESIIGSGYRGLDFGERVVEYPAVVDWLQQCPQGCDLLDVGCTLNNAIIAEPLLQCCRQIMFCNPALERKIQIQNPVFYHLASLECALPFGPRFSLVTCLSTLEHIGYDNSQF